MYAKSGLRVVLKWKIYRPDSVIAAVIRLLMIRITLLITLLAVGCHLNDVQSTANKTGATLLGRDPDTGEPIFALDHSVADSRRLTFSSSLPFRISLGRGSGLYGLETIAIDENLLAVVHRETSAGWETCRVELTINEWGAIVDAIEQNNLFSLDRAYHANVADGTQWVLWIEQNGQSKTVYCNNFFPDQIRKFADEIDIVFDIDDDLLEWKSVPDKLIGNHDNRLWAAIKPNSGE